MELSFFEFVARERASSDARRDESRGVVFQEVDSVFCRVFITLSWRWICGIPTKSCSNRLPGGNSGVLVPLLGGFACAFEPLVFQTTRMDSHLRDFGAYNAVSTSTASGAFCRHPRSVGG